MDVQYDGRIQDGDLVEKHVTELIHHFLEVQTYQTFKPLCYYLDPHTPWSCRGVSDMVRPYVQAHLDFIPQLIADTRPVKRSRIGGLNVSIGQEAEMDLTTISVVYTLIEFYSYHRNWNVVTAHILSLMDHHLILVKYLACKLLMKLTDVIDILATGLTDIFVDKLKLYMTFATEEMDAKKSQMPQLIDICYDLFLQLRSDLDSKLDLLATVTLAIDKRFNRFGESPLLPHLLNKLSCLIEVLGAKILVSLSRVNFVLCQIVTNPYLIDSKSGVIQQVLDIQQKIIVKFYDVDKQGKSLLYNYRFDLLGAWTVVSKRAQIDTTNCVKTLEKIATDLGVELESIY